MKIRFIIISGLIFLLFNTSVFSQNYVRIILEKGRSDIFQLEEQQLTKAYVYGTKENVIKFLINDKYIDHQMDKGIVYNFLFSKHYDDIIVKDWKNKDLQEDTNKILIVTDDSLSYQKIFNKVFGHAHDHKPEYNAFQLGEVNNLKIFISNKTTDTAIFSSAENIAKIILEKDKSDIFQIDGEQIDKVNIYGTKDKIIQFLINDKYIKHKMSEGSNYNFISSSNFSAIEKYFTDDKELSQVLVVLNNDKEFKTLYRKNKHLRQNKMLILEDIPNMRIVVLPPEKLINP